MPIDRLLLGRSQAKEIKLTKKQKLFAEALAMGETKAGAYRKAYNTSSAPKIQSRRGQELAKHGAIQAYKEALEGAFELERISSPARLRSLVISELTKHATNDENSTKERLQALKLLGTVTEVGAFTERREVVTVKASGEIKERLLDSLKGIIDVQAKDKAEDIGASLLAELSAADTQADTIEAEGSPGPDENLNSADPPEGHPPSASEVSAPPLLSNPHNRLNEDLNASTLPSSVEPTDA